MTPSTSASPPASLAPRDAISDPRVAVAHVGAAYSGAAPAGGDDAAVALERGLASVTEALGWASAEGGPFGAAIPAGANVLVKPNWVMHQNAGPWGIEPLVTHGAMVRAVVEALLRSGAGSVTVGDAPLQSCDFDRLMAETELAGWAAALEAREPRFRGLRDFRRTKSVIEDGILERSGDQRALDQFVLFDLAEESVLEPVTDDRGSFRVTCYPPDLMRQTHAPGRHRYLVAREILEADVVVNLPKLKTHRKAGITCALKNLVGINGNKEFLPHHRIGGSEDGGDCYPGTSVVKRALERTLDVQNSLEGEGSRSTRRALRVASRALYAIAARQGDVLGVDGAWSGNDTVWRMCIDLNRVLLYGQHDGTLAGAPRRRVLNVVDAIVAGHGDGPLSPKPLPLGLVVAGASSAAVDWVGSLLLGYAPRRIPITREAFGEFRWPIAAFGPDAVTLAGAGGGDLLGTVLRSARLPADMDYPPGWRDAVDEDAARARGAAL